MGYAQTGFELESRYILETIQRLERRISERFPDSGLSRVGARLVELAATTEAEIERIRKPFWLARVGAGAGILGIVVLVEEIFRVGLPGSLEIAGLADFLQASEAAVNLIILLSLGIFFMISLETRLKRKRALAALYQLRSVVHIVDMHQLTKDPDPGIGQGMTTASPKRELTHFQLSRYLDYCSEMFSLTSKVAALYSQHLNDGVVLAAVNEIESLAASLSHKIWQKIIILNARP
jgi:hypothetical protein